MRKLIVLLSMFLFPTVALSAQPTCHEHPGGSYCAYKGKVRYAYINSANLILVYFDTAMDVSDAKAVGINVTSGSAAAFLVSENPEFAKLFYSTVLAAQASGRDISIQMRGLVGGYPKFDRIWLAEP